MAVSSNGQFLASGASDGVVRLWDTASGQVLRTFELNAGSVRSLDFSPATGELLIAWEDGFLRTFDPKMTAQLERDAAQQHGTESDAAQRRGTP